MPECKHLDARFMKVICSNGAVQVREICEACGANVRGPGVNVPHREVSNLAALPVLSDNRPDPAQQTLAL